MNFMDIVSALCEYFKSGGTEKKNIGLELEHFVLKKDDVPLAYSKGVEDMLDKASLNFDYIHKEDGRILGMSNNKYSVSIEPGAQLEVSVKPCETPGEISRILDEFYSVFNPIVKETGCRLETTGSLSADMVDKIELIPKKRYSFMDEYFKTSGSMGRYMMRASASCQVSVDYENEEDFIKKFRAAYLISPHLALINASGNLGDDGYLKRIDIWNNVDDKRTMPPRGLFDDNFGFRSYAEYIAGVPAIFVPSENGYAFTNDKTCGELFESYDKSEDMLEHFLSMVFPDVRLKKFIEVRIADSVNKEKAVEYAKLVSGILYNKKAVCDILKRYSGMDCSDIKKAKINIREKGSAAVIYGRNAQEELEYIKELSEGACENK